MATPKKTLNILHIDTGTNWRGGQRQVLTLHSLLLKKGVKSSLACNKHGKLYEFAKDKKIPRIIGMEYKSQFSYKCHKEINKISAEINPGIVHCHDSHSVSLVRFLNKPLKFHTRRVSYPINFLSILFKYSSIDVHIGVSNEIRDYMARYFEKSYTIHSCVDKNRFINKESYPKFDSKQINLLFVGAFSTQKGIEILISAFKKLVNSYSNICLHMVGDGKLLDSVRKEVMDNGLSKKVNLYGAKKDIEKFYLASDIVICPSVLGEGSSGVIKEAIAAKKIIVASNLSCNMEIIEDGINGFLFENKNVENLIEVVGKVIDKKAKIDMIQLDKTTKKFSCEKMTHEYLKLYML